MLGWQLYWGAAFYRIFGYTWVALRSSGLAIAVFTTVLLHRLLLRCGLEARNAVLGTLTVVLSPLFLPLAFSFMSDLFGLFVLLACFYCCLRAIDAGRIGDSVAMPIGWLALTTCLGVFGGTTRQIAWVGVLTLMPTAVWMMRKRKSIVAAGIAFWIAGTVGIVTLLHWFQSRPFSVRESFFGQKVDAIHLKNLASNLLGACLELPFLVLPVALGFLFFVPWRKRSTHLLAALMIAGSLAYAAVRMHQHVFRDSLLPTLQGVLSDRGLWFIWTADLEWWPIVLTFLPRVLITGTTLVAIFSVLAVAMEQAFSHPRNTVLATERKALPSMRTLLVLLGPTVVAYGCLLLSRAVFSLLFDRYLLWFMIVAALFGLRYIQRWPHRNVQSLAIYIILALSLYGTAATHDLFAMYRARLSAIDRLREAGISRKNIGGGFEYDGTTELEEAGHLNTALINPASAYIPVPTARTWQQEAYPDVVVQYQTRIAYARETCHSVWPGVPVHNLLGPALVVVTLHPSAQTWAELLTECPAVFNR